MEDPEKPLLRSSSRRAGSRGGGLGESSSSVMTDAYDSSVFGSSSSHAIRHSSKSSFRRETRSGSFRSTTIGLGVPEGSLLSSMDSMSDSGDIDSKAEKETEKELDEAKRQRIIAHRTKRTQDVSTKVSKLRGKLDGSERPLGPSDFLKKAKDEVVHLGEVDVDVLMEQEKQIEELRILNEMAHASAEEQRKQERIEKEKIARERVWEERCRLKEIDEEIKKTLEEEDAMRRAELQKEFQRHEDVLRAEMEDRSAEITTAFGEMEDDEFGGTEARRWRVDSKHTPQPIQIRLVVLRAVKDKLPRGKYVMLVSLYDRLGGVPMKFSNLGGLRWKGASNSVMHDGRFFDVNLEFGESVFIATPSNSDISPPMIFLFELFLLRGGRRRPVDKVVAWAAFPAVSGRFNVVSGRFKAPMIRGEYDPSVKKHSKFEKIYRNDLDMWVGNLYFEVIHLSRYAPGQKEFEVELLFRTSYLEGKEEEEDAIQDLEDVDLEFSDEDEDGKKLLKKDFGKDKHDEWKQMGAMLKAVRILKEKVIRRKSRTSGMADEDDGEEEGKPLILAGNRVSATSKRTTLVDRSLGSRGAAPVITVEETDEPQLLKDLKKDSARTRSRVVQEARGREWDDIDVRSTVSMGKDVASPESSRLSVGRGSTASHSTIGSSSNRGKISLDMYTLSVAPIQHEWTKRAIVEEKLFYIRRALVSDLGLNDWRRKEFWLMIFLLLVILYIRLFPHYFFTWVYLEAFRTPVEETRIYPYTVEFEYRGEFFSPLFEVGSTCSGTAGNIMFFMLMMCISLVSQLLLGYFPILGSRIFFGYGLAVFLDPVLIIIVDNISMNYDYGESYRLERYYEEKEKNGLIGVFLTLFLYCQMMLISAILLYHYSLRLHMNGRMMDVYYRLHGREEEFFAPHDLEVSYRSFEEIMAKSHNWRGEDGAIQKSVVKSYTEKDPQTFLERLHDLLCADWPHGYVSRIRMDPRTKLNSAIRNYARRRFPSFSAAERHDSLRTDDIRKILLSYFLRDEHYPSGSVQKPATWVSQAEIGRQWRSSNDPKKGAWVASSLDILACALFFETEKEQQLSKFTTELHNFDFISIEMKNGKEAFVQRREAFRDDHRASSIVLPRASELARDITVHHIVIMSQSVLGDKELYRHFLVGPKKELVEIFDSDRDDRVLALSKYSPSNIDYWVAVAPQKVQEILHPVDDDANEDDDAPCRIVVS
eukprot:TRINITY_DN24702_c1_g1_i1.p1 TRINITY_DN24702_c1_g1~~TRINITY_DN24702_c1_g1_i1.p1  ORF type:complete len:1211 (+),score=372.92 TRINITY_DN24702_c1_g1_i1:122-3754(+)